MIFPNMQDTRKEQEPFTDVPFKWLEDRCKAYRPSFLLRCLNVGRLAIKPEPLLAMLWFRATLPASSWAAVDHGDLDYVALWPCLFHTSHAEGSFFVTQSRYGQWIQYDKDLWHSKTAVPAPLASSCSKYKLPRLRCSSKLHRLFGIVHRIAPNASI